MKVQERKSNRQLRMADQRPEGRKSHRHLRIANHLPELVDETIYKVAPESVKTTNHYSLFYQAFKTVCLVLFYYCFSISLTFYNKWLFTNFHFPLSVTVFHLAFKFVVALIVRSLLQRATDIKPVTLPWRVYLTRVAPTGLASVFDIGFSNWSMLYITVQLYTMSKSTAIIFILVFGIILRLQEPHISQVLVIFLISGGLFMFTYHSTTFNLLGFILVITASVLSGLRWSLAQILTQGDAHKGGLKNPVDTIYHLQPIMIVGLLPLAVAVEGMEVATSSQVFGFHKTSVFVASSLTVALGGALAFMLAMSEYLLVSQTSSLTLSISGIFKEIITLYLSIHYSTEGKSLSLVNIFGMVVCLLGITIHVIMKAREVDKTAPVVRSKTSDGAPMLLNGDANINSDSEDDLFDMRELR